MNHKTVREKIYRLEKKPYPENMTTVEVKAEVLTQLKYWLKLQGLKYPCECGHNKDFHHLSSEGGLECFHNDCHNKGTSGSKCEDFVVADPYVVENAPRPGEDEAHDIDSW
jgi:hypothetical protein